MRDTFVNLVAINHRWRCPASGCRKSVGLRDGTFFEKSKLTLHQWMVLMYWWCREYPVTDVAQEANVDKKTGIWETRKSTAWVEQK